MEDLKFTKKNIATVLGIFFLYGLASASNEYRVLFLQEQGLSASECGYVLAAAGILMAITRPVSGAIADKLRSRKGLFITAVCAWMGIIILLLTLRSVRIAGFVVCAGIVPFLSACDSMTYGMIEADGVEMALRVRRLDYSIIRMFVSMSYCGINFLYTPIINRFGVNAPYIITLAYLVIMLFVGRGLRFFGESQTGSAEAKKKEKLQFGRLFKNYFLVCFVLLSFVMAVGGSSGSYLVYLVETVGLDKSLIGITTGIRVAGEIIIMPLVPLLKKKVSLPLMQVIAACMTITQMTLYLTCKNPVIIIGSTVFNGLAGGISLGTTAVYLRAMAPEGLVTTTLSLTSIMQSMGHIIMSMVGGYIVQYHGIFSLYRLCLSAMIVWLTLYFGTWAFGTLVLKKKPTIPLFKRAS